MKKNLLYCTMIILAVMIHACSGDDGLKVPGEPLISKLALPVVLQTDSTLLYLQDYMSDPKTIDSVISDPALGITWSADSTMLILKAESKSLPRLSILRFWAQGYFYDVMIKKSPKIWVHYKFNPGKKTYKHVQFAGQMNDWNPSACWLVKRDSLWETDLLLYPGNYQYKLILDGKWVSDPGNPVSVPSGTGGYNSLLRAGNLDDPGLPRLTTVTAKKNKIVINCVEPGIELFVMWENYRLPEKFITTDSTGIIITLPKAARDMERSYIRAWASNREGLSNDLLIPLRNGKVIFNAADLSRQDLHSLIIYFLMVDRFYNGDTKNDHPVADPEIDPRVNFMGGDLKGVIFQMDDEYFSTLGVNAVWLSPVIQNPAGGFNEYPAPHRKFSGYHGYWPMSLTTIDNRFGADQEMKNLIKLAHKKDISIIMDFVAHHVHKDYPVLKQHPDWITNVDLPDGKKNIRIWDEQRLTTWFDIFLPTWDLTRPEVYKMVSDSAVFWVSEYDIDGFRHDAAKHVPEIFWRTLTYKLDSIRKAGGKPFYQIGETFGSRELIGSYIGPGMLDAQFDFNLYWEAKNGFGLPNAPLRDLNTALLQSLQFFGYHNLMGNITGNQDMARFISLAGGALRPGEDEREAAWKDITLKDTLGYYRLSSLMAFNMTVPGVPVIYYGDEFGLPGAGDPDNRRLMKFDSLTPLEKRTYDVTKQLINLRKNSIPLIFGDFVPLENSDKTLAYMRFYFGQYALVAFNKDNRERNIAIDLPRQVDTAGMAARFGNKYQVVGRTLKLTLPSNSFEIITNK